MWKVIFLVLASWFLVSGAADAQTAVFNCKKEGEPVTYVTKPLTPDWSCRAIIVNDPRWIEVAKTADGDPVQVDSKTVSSSPGTTTAWIQQWAVHRIARTGQGTLQRVVSRVEFDCAKRTAKLLMSVEYKLGKSDGAASTPLRPVALPVVPGTVQESELDTLCKKG
ncbi:surface-adhesin E family protein [Xanthomonas campestris]|uniref:surface-adhesin E family protein n=1 Tax=Xanthomonas campestris TaxID=339 RepID=UPI003CCF5E92